MTNCLVDSVLHASAEQISVRRKDVTLVLQKFRAHLDAQPEAMRDWSVLEYKLPREFRRPDVIVLRTGCVVALELKDCLHLTQVALDQAAAYAGELCASRRRKLRLVIGESGDLASCVKAEAVLQSRTSAHVLESSSRLMKAAQCV